MSETLCRESRFYCTKPNCRKLSIRLAFEVYKKLPSASERSCLAPEEYDKIPESEQNGRMLRCEMRYFSSSDGASCFSRRTAKASSPPCTTEELVALSRRKEELLTGGEKKVHFQMVSLNCFS